MPKLTVEQAIEKLKGFPPETEVTSLVVSFVTPDEPIHWALRDFPALSKQQGAQNSVTVNR